MKSSNRFSPLHVSLSLLVLALFTGAAHQTTRAAAGATPSTPLRNPEVVSAVSNSFKAVTAHLDPGGSFYLYLSTESWLQGLSGKVGELRELVTSLPNMENTDRAIVDRVFNLLSALVRGSGLEEISGVGMSGVLLENDLYRTRMMVHHYPSRNQGFIWSLFGAAPRRLGELDYLPADAVLAVGSDLDLAMLWGIIKREVEQADWPDAVGALGQAEGLVQAQTGVELDQILRSLSGPFLVVLTLDEERRMAIPLGAAPLEIAEPRFGLMIRVKDDTLFKILERPLQQHEGVIKVDKPGLKMRTLPLPLPFPVRPTVAQTDTHFFLATQEGLVEEMLAVAQGDKQGLRATDEFKRLSRGIPPEGNQFSYVSRRLGREVNRVIRSVAEAQAGSGGPPAELMEKFMGTETVSFGVTGNTAEGWLTTDNGSQHPGMLLAAPVLVAPTAIIAGMLLPALAKAKARAQSINCVNNLKQIGLAGRIYANDHGDVYPKDFLSMKDEMGSPKILCCPADPNKKPTSDWNQFGPARNLSYEFVAPGVSLDDPSVVVFRCPIHGHQALADGSVRQGRK